MKIIDKNIVSKNLNFNNISNGNSNNYTNSIRTPKINIEEGYKNKHSKTNADK